MPRNSEDPQSVTQNLRRWKEGDSESAGQVFAALQSQLRRMAAQRLNSERSDHTLRPTELINELYLRLETGNSPEWRSRTHFIAVSARTLRRILIDHARARSAQRRGGGETSIPFESAADPGVTCSYDDLLIIDEALTELEKADERAAHVTELRFFGGLLESEIAEELGISEITVKRDWKFARAWLAVRLSRT